MFYSEKVLFETQGFPFAGHPLCTQHLSEQFKSVHSFPLPKSSESVLP